MITVGSRPTSSARERLLDAAYALFSTMGIGRVGIDTIIAQSGCAKSSLYNNFVSKEELAVAFLERREQLWTRNWLESEVKRRASEPTDRLMAIFDLFDEWFGSPDFEGCSFINVLLESDVDSRVRRAAAEHLANIRDVVRGLAHEAGLADSETFTQIWHMLMKGSIISAGEGNRDAARQARCAAQFLLDGWKTSSRRVDTESVA